MKPSLILALATLAGILCGCSSAAPTAPIGLNRHPANSPEAVASLARLPADQTATAVAQNVPPPQHRQIPAPIAPAHFERPAVLILSDASAPGGVEALPADERAALVSAARSAQSIRLLCRGDRERPTRAGWTAAVARGFRIKRFLVAAGVEPQRIRIYARSAGAFVADNSKPSGRAQNRRVEIHFG